MQPNGPKVKQNKAARTKKFVNLPNRRLLKVPAWKPYF